MTQRISDPQSGNAGPTSGSVFDGIQLLSRLPRYATLDELLRLDAPVGARFRAIADSWVAADTAAERDKLRTDLLRPGTSAGTWHELILREILRRKFGAVERNPPGLPLGTKTPDFGVRVGRRQRLVVFESASISDKVDEETHRLRAIVRRLDRISGPWYLAPDWSLSRGLAKVPPTVVEAAVVSEIAGLSPGNHELNIPFGEDAVLRASLLSASSHRDSIVAFDIPRVARNPGVKAMRDDIKEKTYRYRPLQASGIPFILAVGTGLDPGMNRWESMFSAMYGYEVVKSTLDDDGHVVAAEGGRLDSAGMVTPGKGSPPRYRTLSAAWLIRWRMYEDELYAEVVHFPNPWAVNRVRILGTDIARVTYARVNSRQVTIRPPRQLRLLKVS